MRPLSRAAVVVSAVGFLSLFFFASVRAQDALRLRPPPSGVSVALATVPPTGAPGVVTRAHSSPVTFALIAAGTGHTCALDARGAAFCWGSNSFGQLGATAPDTCKEKGDGKPVLFACALRPVAVDGVLRYTALALGNLHTCGLAADGIAYCWGDNTLGQLGVDSVPDTCLEGGVTPLPCSRKPVPVAGSLHFTRLAAGRYHTCGLLADGSMRCWGSNQLSQLGSKAAIENCTKDTPNMPPAICIREPALVAASFTGTAVVAGKFHTCALATDSTAYCWGAQRQGDRASTPKPAPGGRRFKELAAGGLITCGLAADGVPYCWGTFQAGPDLLTGILEPERGGIWLRKEDSHFETVTIGEAHMCGLAAGGQAFCWGRGNEGQLGVKGGLGKLLSKERGSADPVAVAGDLRFRGIAAGGAHTCAVTIDGAAYCWGVNPDGRLGDGTTSNRDVPTAVVTGQIAAAQQ